MTTHILAPSLHVAHTYRAHAALPPAAVHVYTQTDDATDAALAAGDEVVILDGAPRELRAAFRDVVAELDVDVPVSVPQTGWATYPEGERHDRHDR